MSAKLINRKIFNKNRPMFFGSCQQAMHALHHAFYRPTFTFKKLSTHVNRNIIVRFKLSLFMDCTVM